MLPPEKAEAREGPGQLFCVDDGERAASREGARGLGKRRLNVDVGLCPAPPPVVPGVAGSAGWRGPYAPGQSWPLWPHVTRGTFPGFSARAAGMTQKPGHAQTVTSLCLARRGRDWSLEDGAGLGARRVGEDDPPPIPLHPTGSPVRRLSGGRQSPGVDIHALRLRQQRQGHQRGDGLALAADIRRPGSHGGDTAGPSRREERQEAFPGQAAGREPLQGRTQVTSRAGWSLVCPPCGQPLSVPFLVSPARLSLPWPAAPQQGREGPRGAPGTPLCCLL